MADFLSPAERSARMALIRSNDTSPEVTLRRALHRLGLRYVLRKKGLPGKPDLVFPKHRAVVFVHGCFWHLACCRFHGRRIKVFPMKLERMNATKEVQPRVQA